MKPLVIQCQSPTPVGRIPKAPSSKIDPISNSIQNWYPRRHNLHGSQGLSGHSSDPVLFQPLGLHNASQRSDPFCLYPTAFPTQRACICKVYTVCLCVLRPEHGLMWGSPRDNPIRLKQYFSQFYNQGSMHAIPRLCIQNSLCPKHRSPIPIIFDLTNSHSVFRTQP